jgi:hypothetical protein
MSTKRKLLTLLPPNRSDRFWNRSDRFVCTDNPNWSDQIQNRSDRFISASRVSSTQSTPNSPSQNAHTKNITRGNTNEEMFRAREEPPKIPIEYHRQGTNWKSQMFTKSHKLKIKSPNEWSQAPPQPKTTSKQKLGKERSKGTLYTQKKRRRKPQPEDKTSPKPQGKLKTCYTKHQQIPIKVNEAL